MASDWLAVSNMASDWLAAAASQLESMLEHCSLANSNFIQERGW